MGSEMCIRDRFNEIIENVQVISSAEEALKSDVAEKVASISGDIITLKTDITNSMSSNSTLLAGKLEEILSDLSAKDDNLFASLSKLSTEAQNLIQAQQSASISKADEVLAELRELIKNATSINQENIETFRCEKSARNNHVSSTREFWNLGSKTKSWNFFEVR